MATVELLTERMVAGGDAIAREPSGRVVFVTGALPGERVRARLTEEKADFARAALVEVLAAAEARRPPPCPYVSAGCGGCGWQHVTEQEQVRLKAAIVREALTRTGRLVNPRSWPDRRSTRSASGPPCGWASTPMVGPASVPAGATTWSRSTTAWWPTPCWPSCSTAAATRERRRSPCAAVLAPANGWRWSHRPRRRRRSCCPPTSPRGTRPATTRRWRASGSGSRRDRSSRAVPTVPRSSCAWCEQAAGDLLDEGVLVDAYAGVGLFGATLPARG